MLHEGGVKHKIGNRIPRVESADDAQRKNLNGKGAGGGQERLCVSHFRRERPFKQTHKARLERIRMGDDKNENQK